MNGRSEADYSALFSFIIIITNVIVIIATVNAMISSSSSSGGGSGGIVSRSNNNNNSSSIPFRLSSAWDIAASDNVRASYILGVGWFAVSEAGGSV